MLMVAPLCRLQKARAAAFAPIHPQTLLALPKQGDCSDIRSDA